MKILTLILCFLTVSMFAQKKEIYLNDDFIEISEDEYRKPEEHGKFLNLQYESDTLITNVKVQRIKKGAISDELLDKIQSELSEISGETILENNILLIFYHPGKDHCNSGGNDLSYAEREKKYHKRFNKIENLSHFYIYKEPEGIEEIADINWFKDEFGTIENTFFPIHYPCGSYVLINPEGNYYAYKGEYDKSEIFQLLKRKNTTFSNN